MKKLLFIAFAIALVGCEKDVKADYAIISGKITNKQKGDLTINTEDRSFKEILTVSPEGTFTDTLDTDVRSYVLFDGSHPVFINVEPGYNLDITYDANNFENTIKITGVGSEVNNYLLAKRKTEVELSRANQEIYSLDEAGFKARMLAFKSTQEDFLSHFKGLPEDFIRKEKNNINYGYLGQLSNYERGHQHFTKKEGFQVSPGFLQEVDRIDFTNGEDFEFSNTYKQLVTGYYGKIANDLVQSEGVPFDMAFLKTASGIENETIKNTLLFDFASFNLSYAKDTEAFYKLFIESSTSEKNNKIITEQYEKMVGITKGRTSPKFINYENHAGGKTSLDDLKGKYVYVDVWATWCGPCKAEIPSLKRVEKQYHGKNIEFVSISIDKTSDHDKWKAMVTEKELGGIQLFADNEWNSTFIKEYQITGIPRFILIDTDGKVVNANAPRPSNPELIELFTSLNI